MINHVSLPVPGLSHLRCVAHSLSCAQCKDNMAKACPAGQGGAGPTDQLVMAPIIAVGTATGQIYLVSVSAGQVSTPQLHNAVYVRPLDSHLYSRHKLTSKILSNLIYLKFQIVYVNYIKSTLQSALCCCSTTS